MADIPDNIIEALEYMSDTFMPDEQFDALVADGYGSEQGGESWTMRGDDMAGFCGSFNEVLRWAGVDRDIMRRERSKYETPRT